jgi:hypothetical protein
MGIAAATRQRLMKAGLARYTPVADPSLDILFWWNAKMNA